MTVMRAGAEKFGAQQDIQHHQEVTALYVMLPLALFAIAVVVAAWIRRRRISAAIDDAAVGASEDSGNASKNAHQNN